jgi:hypothetical protein
MNSRRLAESHYGIPCADWLRTVMNRINPDLFMARFSSWVAECWPDAQSILDAEADYLLAVKDNQPTLHADIKSYSTRRLPTRSSGSRTSGRTPVHCSGQTVPVKHPTRP